MKNFSLFGTKLNEYGNIIVMECIVQSFLVKYKSSLAM